MALPPPPQQLSRVVCAVNETRHGVELVMAQANLCSAQHAAHTAYTLRLAEFPVRVSHTRRLPLCFTVSP